MSQKSTHKSGKVIFDAANAFEVFLVLLIKAGHEDGLGDFLRRHRRRRRRQRHRPSTQRR